MRVLVACEFSGTVRDAFAAKGHDAWSCDLLPSEKPGQHFQKDILSVARHQFDYGKWDLMIAHPPCTYLTVSAAWAFEDGPYHQQVKPGTLVGAERRQAREEALEFVRLLLGAPIPMIALENPIGAIGTRVRPADQIIQPWAFGEDASKATCLWLKNLPTLTPTSYVAPRLGAGGRPVWANQTDTGQNGLSPSEKRSQDRAITYKGIAAAMADQWTAG